MEVMLQAVRTVRPAFDEFYNSLTAAGAFDIRTAVILVAVRSAMALVIGYVFAVRWAASQRRAT